MSQVFPTDNDNEKWAVKISTGKRLMRSTHSEPPTRKLSIQKTTPKKKQSAEVIYYMWILFGELIDFMFIDLKISIEMERKSFKIRSWIAKAMWQRCAKCYWNFGKMADGHMCPIRCNSTAHFRGVSWSHTTIIITNTNNTISITTTIIIGIIVISISNTRDRWSACGIYFTCAN